MVFVCFHPPSPLFRRCRIAGQRLCGEVVALDLLRHPRLRRRILHHEPHPRHLVRVSLRPPPPPPTAPGPSGERRSCYETFAVAALSTRRRLLLTQCATGCSHGSLSLFSIIKVAKKQLDHPVTDLLSLFSTQKAGSLSLSLHILVTAAEVAAWSNASAPPPPPLRLT